MPKRPKPTEAKIVKNMLFRLFLNSASIANDGFKILTSYYLSRQNTQAGVSGLNGIKP